MIYRINHKEKLQLTITNPDKLIFGSAPYPVKCKRGFEIGNGEVYPEINFTPSMILDESSRNTVRSIYSEIIKEICKRAVELKTHAIVVEFELLPPMTMNPEILN